MNLDFYFMLIIDLHYQSIGILPVRYFALDPGSTFLIHFSHIQMHWTFPWNFIFPSRILVFLQCVPRYFFWPVQSITSKNQIRPIQLENAVSVYWVPPSAVLCAGSTLHFFLSTFNALDFSVDFILRPQFWCSYHVFLANFFARVNCPWSDTNSNRKIGFFLADIVIMCGISIIYTVVESGFFFPIRS